jgi:hypothetical protein
MEGHKDLLMQDVAEVVGKALGMARRDIDDEIDVLMKKLTAVELQLAEARGALDILRGKGIPGGLNVKGTFNNGTTYLYRDVVAFNGSSWVAVEDNPGRLPGPGWQLLSSVSPQ